MGEINSAQYSSVFPRFLLSLGFHPLGEDAKSCESPWLLVETAFFTPLSVDLGIDLSPLRRARRSALAHLFRHVSFAHPYVRHCSRLQSSAGRAEPGAYRDGAN